MRDFVRSVASADGTALLRAWTYAVLVLQWRHNERDGVSNHRRFDCLLTRLS